MDKIQTKKMQISMFGNGLIFKMLSNCKQSKEMNGCQLFFSNGTESCFQIQWQLIVYLVGNKSLKIVSNFNQFLFVDRSIIDQ